MTQVSNFGVLPSGQEVARIELRTADLSVSILTLGAAVQDILFDGRSVVLGGDALSDYTGDMAYFGAIVGRVANRIANAKAPFEPDDLTLDANEANGNCLHGGRCGTSELVWDIEQVDETSVTLTLTLEDGHMGFPARMHIRAKYSLYNSVLSLVLEATSDGPTFCNLAPHSYFNLSGEASINDHDLWVDAHSYLPINERSIPTGEIASVDHTQFDFQTPRRIGTAQIDHNLCLGLERSALRPIARLSSAASNISMEILSTEAGLQIYTCDHLPVSGVPASHARLLGPRAGVALETQGWPDAPNWPAFPSIALDKGELYRAETEFAFSKSD